jgi:predicted nucleic acid-binding Zn ribbon protein
MTETQCVECGSEISEGVTLCSKCGSYQSRKKNLLLFISKVASALSVLAAAIIYISSTLLSLYEQYNTTDDVEVISFASHDEAVILNKGDGPVFISHFSLKAERGGTAIVPVNKTLEPNQILTHSTDSERFKRLAKYKLISGKVLDDWISENKHASGSEDACTVYAVIHENDPKMQLMSENYGNKKFTGKGETALHYYSLKSKKKITVNFPSRTVYLANPDCNLSGNPK